MTNEKPKKRLKDFVKTRDEDKGAYDKGSPLGDVPGKVGDKAKKLGKKVKKLAGKIGM